MITPEEGFGLLVWLGSYLTRIKADEATMETILSKVEEILNLRKE